MCLGVPGRIVSIADPLRPTGVVDIAGVRRIVDLSCVIGDPSNPGACVGSWVLVHVGFAMSRLDEGEARATLELLESLGEMQAELAALQQAADDALADAPADPQRRAA